jgi:hypothetical protein
MAAVSIIAALANTSVYEIAPWQQMSWAGNAAAETL